MNKIQPKKENENRGFSYEVSDEMLAMYQKWTVEERLNWVFETAHLVLSHQTPEQRELMRKIKNDINY